MLSGANINKKILLVDDSAFDREKIMRALRGGRSHMAYEFRELECGVELAQVCRDWQPDLVILDYALPAFDGLSLLKELIAVHGRLTIPVIIATGAGNQEVAVAAMKLGALDYIVKGQLTPDLIRDTVDRALEKSALQRSLAEQQELLRQSQSRLELALTAAGMGILEWEFASQLLYCSPETERIMGCQPGTPKRILDDFVCSIHPDDRQATLRHLSRVFEGPGQFHVEFRIVAAAGVNWVAVDGRTKFDEQHQPERFMGTVLDITARKNVEFEIKRAKELAELVGRAKSEFLANISHEIRTPLTAIVGFAELALDADQSEADRRLALETIRRNASLLSELINDILDLSKIEAGRLDVEKSQVALAMLIDEVIATLTLKAKNKGILLESKCDANVPSRILSDPLRVKQCLFNVIGNAIKFTHKGHVLLHIGAVPSASGSCELVISVTDTGVGIAPENQGQLFQRFSQAEASTTRRFGGTGLGLFLTKRLAQCLGGDLFLKESVPDVGSTFVLTIDAGPAADAVCDVSVLGPAARAQKTSLGGVRVLVVDDVADNRLLIGHMLATVGASVNAVASGEEAIQEALHGPYDVVLMDIQMGPMDGYEAMRGLRQHGFLSPIIALSAHAMRTERERSLREGFDEYLSKPVHRDELVAALQRTLH